MNKTILKQRTPENTYFDDLLIDIDESNTFITGNDRYKSFGNNEFIKIANNDYYDDELGYDYDSFELLENITGKKWDRYCITGYSQSDWNYVYYVVDEISLDTIKDIANYYFGKLTMYDVYESDNNDPDDVVYIPDDVAWRGKKAICDYIGCDPENTTILETDGYIKQYKYKEVK